MSKAIVLLGDLGSDHEGFPPTPVIAGSPDVLIDGKPAARVGDPLAPHSKPKHSPHPRTITGGSATVMINGKPAAVTGGAISCGGVTIGSGSVLIGDTHTPAPFSGVSPTTPTPRAAKAPATSGEPVRATPEKLNPIGKAESLASPTNSLSATSPGTNRTLNTSHPDADDNRDLSEPGFHVVREPMSRNELLSRLYGDASAKPDNFERLNPGLGNRVLPGEMIVIADPESLECTVEENDLMTVAAQVNQEVRQLSEQEAQFIVDHYDLLELMTANAATGMGAGAAMIGQQIKSINMTLKDIEALYQNTFRKHGRLNVPEFYEQRRALFTKLDFALGNMARKGLSLDDNPKLKRALGLSTKGTVHHWKEAGVGPIPGYGAHYSKAAGAARFVEHGGRLVVALDAGLAGYKIYEACSTGRANECEQVAYVESGRFAGSAIGGAVGASIAPVLCTVVGIGTGGIGGVACGIIAAGIGGAAGGKIMGDAGAGAGQLVYEVRSDE
ncbi:type VI secretion system PAAR protein [Marinobacter sp.]|uniref:type VI secretion system PAAR protein n=1 Tax=Marinobacter sp. TaxID=50741 RepID=UPI0035C71500